MREFGDFQTPVALAELVLRAVHRPGTTWRRALEPTCGAGNFIRALVALPDPPRDICGLELQDGYLAQAEQAAGSNSTSIRVRIHHGDIFKTNLAELSWLERGPLLVVGNPPWVTSAELGALDSKNLPKKSNLKGLRGFDARTGESNFDITEYIWIKLIKELAWAQPTIALLCKTAVARNVLRFAHANDLPISSAELYQIDAKKWFGAAVDACLFRVEVGFSSPNYTAAVYEDLLATEPQSVLRVNNGTLVSDAHTYERVSFIEGQCGFEWRQGVKHDLSGVMELRESEGELRDRNGERVDVEKEYIFPLFKSSDLQTQQQALPRYSVIITQQKLGDDTAELQWRAPRLWAYLNVHNKKFDDRKSSIYEGRPRFSIFGIGEYSFSPFKVAVSGMYKKIQFRMLPPHDGKPAMLDDTCYFLACDSAERACVLAELLNHSMCLSFLSSIVFKDSKRPVTKKILQRVDLTALWRNVDKAALLRGVNARLANLGAPIIETVEESEQYLRPNPGQQFAMPLLEFSPQDLKTDNLDADRGR